jgi:hypothetical protein
MINVSCATDSCGYLQLEQPHIATNTDTRQGANPEDD